MKVTNVSPGTTLKHATAAAQGDRSPRAAATGGVRVTDGGPTEVYPARILNFRGAQVIDLDGAEVDILIRGTGTNFTNDDGDTLDYGAVVVVDTSSNLVTTTTAQDTRPVGIVQRSTNDQLPAPVVFSGYVAQINTTGTVNSGDFLETSTSAGLARSSGTTRRIGSFAQALTAGPNPSAIMWSPPDAVTGTGSGGGGLGGLVAIHTYRPGSNSNVATTTSATLADADATNLIITFIAPPTGNVLVRLASLADVTAVENAFWGIREGSTDLISGIVQGGFGTEHCSIDFYITGVSAGSHTYKWSFAVSGGATHDIVGGPTFGEAVMEVWTAP